MLDMIKIRYREYGVDKCGKYRYHVQFRINKKGAECFRTGYREEAEAKLAELSAKRPGIYTMQHRYVRLNKYGVEEHPHEDAQWR